MAEGALSNLVVLELSDTPGAAFAASLMADFGAQVFVCEPKDGTPLRKLGPEGGVLWKILARNKKSVVLDDLESALRTADILITDRAAPPAAWEKLPARERPLLVAVFPTGADRPDLWNGNPRSEFAAAAAGMMALTGEENGPAQQPEGPLADYLAGALAAARAFGALRLTHLTGETAQPIAMALHQAVQRLIEWQLPVASAFGKAEVRRGNSFPLNAGIANMHRCKEGIYVAISAVTQVTAERLMQMIGGDALRTDPRFATPAARQKDLSVLYKIIDDWVGARTLAEVEAAAAQHDVILGPVFTTREILSSKHMAARASFTTLDGVIMPSVFPLIEGVKTEIKNLGPALGAHGNAVARSTPRVLPANPAPAKRFKVLELGSVIAGPLAGSLLAELGGDVIKIEPPGAGDPLRQMGPKKNGVPLWFGVSARAKRCISLNLKDPDGKALFRQLLTEADVLVENNRPGVLDRLGFGWKDMQSINPRLVQLSISGFGQTGPESAKPGFGKIAEGMSGTVSLTGERANSPLFVGFSLADASTGLFGVFAVMLALYRRDVRGAKGTRIDLALYESLFRMLDCQLALHKPNTPTLRNGTNDPYGFGAPDKSRPRFTCVQRDGMWRFTDGTTEIPVFDGARLAAHAYFTTRGDVIRTTVAEIGELVVPGPIAPIDAPEFRAPAVGADNAAVLAELGVMAADIERLRTQGAI
ncbi:MAG: CoA transferase [Rhodospirillaceae bacterium]|nr:CoA transferase [Rhodospirillaceae bacterium]